MDEEEKKDEEGASEDEKIDAAAEKLFNSFVKRLESKQEKVADEKAKAIAEAEAKMQADKMFTCKIAGMDVSIEKTKLASRKGAYKGSDAEFLKVGEFIKALITNDKQKLQIMVEGTDGVGGYLVPEEWANQIVETKLDMAIIRPRATVVPITTNLFHLPSVISRPKVYWRNEAATKQTSSFGLNEITLTPYSLAVIVPLSQELVDDAQVGLQGSIINLVTRLLSEAVSREEDDCFAGQKGNGTGRPTGISTYAGIKEINAGNALNGSHIVGAFYKVPVQYRNNGFWIMSSDQMSIVQGLKDTTGRFIFSDALTTGGLPTLKGRPVLEHNNLGIASILFGDISAYWIADRQGIRVRVSDEATVASTSAFEKNLVYVRVEERVDGELADTAAFAEITNAK